MLVSLVPRPHPQEGKGLGALKHFLGLVHHHVTSHAPIQTYAKNHMIAERLQNQENRPFPRVCGGVWERD